MAKDAYWFRHDASAGRGLKLRQIQHIYTHWGKGVYWDVLEILREQDKYRYEHSDAGLSLLCDLVNVSDKIRFLNWFSDCVKLELFIKDEKYFYSEILTENMQVWEIKKSNGGKGGRPKKNETKPNHKPKVKAKRNHKIIEDNIILYKESFNSFRISYPGTKLGLDTEFNNFVKKHKDWKEVTEQLLPILNKQIKQKETLRAAGGFVAEWKNLSTWINNRCWEEELPEPKQIVPNRSFGTLN